MISRLTRLCIHSNVNIHKLKFKKVIFLFQLNRQSSLTYMYAKVLIRLVKIYLTTSISNLNHITYLLHLILD